MENSFFNNIEEYIAGVEPKIVIKVDGKLYFEDDLVNEININLYLDDYKKAKDKFNIKLKVIELKNFLNNTQFKFSDDYDLKNTPEWIKLKTERQKARDFIRNNDA